MSTIVNTPEPERTVVQSDSSGWAVAVVILLLVIAGGAYYFVRHRAPAPAPAQPVIQVNLPGGNQPAPQQ